MHIKYKYDAFVLEVFGSEKPFYTRCHLCNTYTCELISIVEFQKEKYQDVANKILSNMLAASTS